MTTDMLLRDVIAEDLPIFFEYQLDADANSMAAFTAENPSDRDAFDAHWKKILSDVTTVNKTILLGGQAVGHIARFQRWGKPEVTYWIDKAHWGKGVATHALSTLLKQVTERPIYARTAKDNSASIRVLEKCGFRISGEDKGFANARRQEIEEYLLELKAEEDSARS